MPDLLNDKLLGSLIDELDSEDEQSDLNSELLLEHDRKNLIESMNYKISKYQLEELFNKLDLKNIEYFKQLLNEVARIYSLNFIKEYINQTYSNKNIVAETIKFITYLKIRLIKYIEEGRNDINNIKINKNIKRDLLEQFLIDDNAPEILNYAIKYIDKESYQRFISRLFYEINLDYIEYN